MVSDKYLDEQFKLAEKRLRDPKRRAVLSRILSEGAIPTVTPPRFTLTPRKAKSV
jgi:hypothetical protein